MKFSSQSPEEILKLLAIIIALRLLCFIIIAIIIALCLTIAVITLVLGSDDVETILNVVDALCHSILSSSKWFSFVPKVVRDLRLALALCKLVKSAL